MFGEDNYFITADKLAQIRASDVKPGMSLVGEFGDIAVKSVVKHPGVELYKVSSPESYYVVTGDHVLCLIAGANGDVDALGNKVLPGEKFYLSVDDCLARGKDVYGYRATLYYPFADPGIGAYEFGVILSYSNYMQKLLANWDNKGGVYGIPLDYMRNDPNVRLGLLAGYIDGLGSYWPGKGLTFPVANEKLKWDLYLTAKSLGYHVETNPDEAWIEIYGDLEKLPVLTLDLQGENKAVSPYYVPYIEPIGKGVAYEFSCYGVNGNHLIVDDFSAVHC